jgi:hypothetical protein
MKIMPDSTFDRAAGSHSLVATVQRERQESCTSGIH